MLHPGPAELLAWSRWIVRVVENWRRIRAKSRDFNVAAASNTLLERIGLRWGETGVARVDGSIDKPLRQLILTYFPHVEDPIWREFLPTVAAERRLPGRRAGRELGAVDP